ncbi:MAG: hypothetical protein QOE86_2300 [Solirubrobacteraceae bacterium]|jgi:hypothetical protein|nr:hypothetical protein [Solirubrobacteraceae bacterium]
MKPTRTHLAAVAAALSMIAIAAPASTAVAAPLPVRDQPASVVGPTFITDGTATFTNLTLVTSTQGVSSVHQPA